MVFYSALHWAKKAEKSAEKCEQIQEDLDASGLDLSKYAKKSEVVHNTGDETIDGVKTFNNTVLSYNPLNAFNSLNKNITRGTAPTSEQGGFLTRTSDKYNINLAGIYYMHTIENENSLSMLVYDPTKSSGYDQAFLRLGYDGSGSWVETVKPANNGSQSSANIATVGWVNNPSASLNVLHRTGNESFSGTKTMLDQRFIFGATNLGSYKEIEARSEKGSTRLGVLRFQNGSDGVTRAIDISVVDNANTNRGGLKVGVNSSGDTYATAPHPKKESNNDDIATTSWVRTLINNSSDVVESGENWVKFKKGLILQWGVGAKGSTISITLPKPFTTTSYNVICTNTAHNGYVFAPTVDTKTTTSFIIHCYGGASGHDTMWFAIGF